MKGEHRRRRFPHPAEHAKKRQGQGEEGKEGERSRRVQERQALEHWRLVAEPILCSCNAAGGARGAV